MSEIPAYWLEQQAKHRERVTREQAQRREMFAELMPVIDFWTKNCGAKVVYAENGKGQEFFLGDRGRDAKDRWDDGLPVGELQRILTDHRRVNERRVRVGAKEGAGSAKHGSAVLAAADKGKAAGKKAAQQELQARTAGKVADARRN